MKIKGVQVYQEMILQICQDYSGLPDIRTLSSHEIRFFFKPLIPGLKEATKPQKRS